MLSSAALGIGLFSISYLALDKGQHTYGKLVIGIIVAMVWLISGQLLLEITDLTKQIYVASLPVAFFILLPSLYWYHISLTAESEWTFSRQASRHLMTLVFASPLSLSILAMPSSDFIDLFFGDSDSLSTWSTINAAWFGLCVILWVLLACFYSIRIIKQTGTYHRQIKHVFADEANKKLNWIVFLICLLMTTWVYALFVLVFDNSLSDYFIHETGVSVLLLFFVWVFCLHGIKQTPALIEVGLMESKQYERSGIDADRLERIATKIQQVIIVEKVFLDPDINAVKLSNRLGISNHYLSQTFSQEMRTTFYDYVNAARVDMAKIDLVESDRTVLDIATGVGFNSRSSFYNAFKKSTGVTPSAFRKSNTEKFTNSAS